LVRLQLLALSLIAGVPPARGTPPEPSAPAPRALMAVVRGDAFSLEVVTAVAKPHAWRAFPLRGTATHQARLVDSAGKTLSHVPLETTGICLDLSHVGAEPHVIGDTLIPHEIVQLIRLPHLDATHELVLERLGPPIDGEATSFRVGAVTRAQLDGLLAISAARVAAAARKVAR
jgi:hypothetical protein